MNINAAFRRFNSVTFFKHSKFYFLGNIFSKGINILLMPIFTRILSTSDYGIIAIYQTFINVFVIVGTLCAEQSIRHVYLKEKHLFKEFTGTILNYLFLFNLLFILILWFLQDTVINLFELQKGLFIYALINLFFGVGNAVYNMYLMASQKSRKYMILQLLSAIFIPAFAIPLVIKADYDKYLWRIIPQVAIIGLLGIYSFISLIRISKFGFNFQYLKKALSYSIPLLPHFLATFILIQFDRIAINKIIGPSATGIYSFAYSVGFILNAIFNSTNAAWLPIFYKNLKEKSHDFLKLKMVSYIKGIFIVSALLIIFAKEAIWILADPKFYSSLILVPSIVLGITFTFLFTIYISYLYYIEKTKMISVLTISAGILNIVLNVIFIPKYGIIAAALTTLISYIFLFCGSYLLVKKLTVAEKDGFLRINATIKHLIFLIIVTTVYQLLYINEVQYWITIPLKIVTLFLLVILFIKKEDVTFLNQLMQNKQP